MTNEEARVRPGQGGGGVTPLHFLFFGWLVFSAGVSAAMAAYGIDSPFAMWAMGFLTAAVAVVIISIAITDDVAEDIAKQMIEEAEEARRGHDG